MNMNIGTKVLVALLTAVALLIVVLVLSYRGVKEVAGSVAESLKPP